MMYSDKVLNVVLSGGGIRGIAYLGAFSTAEDKGYQIGNMAGVSAGALVGSLYKAGYRSDELKRVMDEFDFEDIKIEDIPKKIPIVSDYMDFVNASRTYIDRSMGSFMNIRFHRNEDRNMVAYTYGYRGNFLDNLITFCKEGCLYDGDYLEEWVSKTLLKKGIRTFADLKGGVADKVNPGGYKMRMTAVDATRSKIIILPDDAAFYGINPDRLEVAKAVRMSTSVPFAFKPVELVKKEADNSTAYSIVDGGVFDNFPVWLIGNSKARPLIGFRLKGAKKGIISLDTPLNIIKGIIASVHDIGIPKGKYKIDYVADINVSKISFLDLNLTEKEKEYMINAGTSSAGALFRKLETNYWTRQMSFQALLYQFFRRNRLLR